MTGPAHVVHIDADGDIDFLAFGATDARFLVIDERAPHDRVYSITVRSPRSLLGKLIGGSVVGDRFDHRHDALSERLIADLAGRPQLRVVDE